jgi:hypothetical protein
MQVPAFHGQRDQETAHEQEDARIHVTRCDCISLHDAQHREKNQRQQRSGGDRQRFGDPPDGDQDCRGGSARHGWMQRIESKRKHNQQEQRRTQRQPDLVAQCISLVGQVFTSIQLSHFLVAQASLPVLGRHPRASIVIPMQVTSSPRTRGSSKWRRRPCLCKFHYLTSISFCVMVSPSMASRHR